MVYQYKLARNRILSYNTTGSFECSDKSDDHNERAYFDHEGRVKGSWQRKMIDEKMEQTKDGELTTTKVLRWKASKEQPPVCKCGKEMIWKGYTVWLKKEDPNAKIIGGMFRMGTSKDKMYWTKHFKKKTKQMEFIKKFLAKEK